ncbi:MAG: hypothetical protein EBV86_15540 [Marivivens sp.]|nr:hypothetical protein [Marivivens sp.]
MNPSFPIFIPSKGRWETRLTMIALERMNCPYKVIVEEQEYKNYCSVIDKKKILVLDKSYQENYQVCDELGIEFPVGSGAVRNFAWDYSINEGHKWHWVMDDNIRAFYRFHDNQIIYFNDGVVFKMMEHFVLRYKNIGMAGPNYEMFVVRKRKYPPFQMNTRIYSCNLIRNDLPFRWRGRYNEDTILSLDMLKNNWCTVLFNAFLQDKAGTQRIKGGNTDVLYKEGTTRKSQMLVNEHPDVSKVVYKFNRVHHVVDYKPFQNIKLIKKDDLKLKNKVNNYGMKLTKRRV